MAKVAAYDAGVAEKSDADRGDRTPTPSVATPKRKKNTGKQKKTKLENPFAIGLSGSAEVTERKLGKTQ